MLTTRTGGNKIGFRRGWSDWQKDLSGTLAWAKETMAEAGATNLFCVMLPKDPSLSRSENFGYMVEALGELCPKLEAVGARLAVEGWPGPGALCCTPEGYRAAIKEVGSKGFGINYDPSHLLRMGIDPIRFVEEFAGSVAHVHGKDTEILEDALYEYGTEQPATFAKAMDFGAWHWRYTIPGHGRVRWTRAFQILAAAGYSGAVSIELEDEAFNGTEAGEKQGILLGAQFLSGV
ncbi:sugar phosphate isomerase/epimerase [bacterium]|nr:MAG: sugar phosphate isomerase/epimerase [bacterium]